MSSPLADLLVQRGIVAPDRLAEALRTQAVAGGSLDTALLEHGAATEQAILQALGQASGLNPINLTEFEPNREVSRLLPAAISQRLVVVPLSVENRTLHVATAFPVPKNELIEVGTLLGREVVPWVAIEVRVRDWMATLYRLPLTARHEMVLAAIDPDRPLPLTRIKSKPAAPLPGTGAEEELARQMVERAARAVLEEPLAQQGPQEPSAAADAAARPATSTPKRHRTQPSFPIPPELAALSSAAPAAPPAAPAPARVAQPPAEPAVPEPEPAPEWTVEQARAALGAVKADREALKEVILRYARRTFDFVAAFAVIRGTAVGWDARGDGAQPGAISQLSIPLDAASVFRTVAFTRASYVGPPPGDGLTRQLLEQLGRAPRTVFLYPVEVKSRMVAILYGDSGAKPISQRRLSDLLLVCQELPAAFAELIVQRKHRGRFERGAPELSGEAAPGPAGWGASWTPSSQPSLSGLGRAASLATLTHSEEERPPPDFTPLLRRLTGPDAAHRARAMAELARTPEASARVLVASFPGPTAWSRLPVQELPDADELGPVSAALVRLGRPAAQALAPLLDSSNSDVRYFALLAAGNLVFPELVPGVLRALFDLDPDISSAARAAAGELRHLPRFDTSMRDLRQELTSRDLMRRSLAARALGVLHDRESIDGLIGLTGSEDTLLAQAAADALTAISRATLGTQPQAWKAWWAENRARRRSQWLVAALRHPDLEQRLAAFEELSSVMGDALGYVAEAAPSSRESAIRQWEAAVLSDPRLRKLDG